MKLSAKAAEVESETPVALLSNLKLQVLDTSGQAVKGDLYGKVVGPLKAGQDKFDARFTSIPKEVGHFSRVIYRVSRPGERLKRCVSKLGFAAKSVAFRVW